MKICEILTEKIIDVKLNAKDKNEAINKMIDLANKSGKITDIGKARRLGYKDKKGFVVARIRIRRGGRTKTRPRKGRRSKRMTKRKVLKMNYRWVAEQRVQRRFTNLEVLNSYKTGQDGKHYFFEVILVDPNRPEIQKSKDVNWILNPANKKRVMRGLTSAGKKSRGLRKKTRQLKVRPSIRARHRQGK